MSDRILIPTSESPARPARRRRGGGLGFVAAALAITLWTIWPDPAPPPAADPTLLPRPFTAPEGTWVETAFTGEGTFTSVVASGERLVAAGSGRRVDSVPFVWVSSDAGATWGQAAGAWGAGELISAVARSDNGYVATGYRIGDDFRGGLTDAEPRVWHSEDGMDWRTLRTTGLPESAVITDLTATADGLVAIGWEGPAAIEPMTAPIDETTPRAWTSRDGTIWRDTTPETSADWFADVTVTESGVAIGGSSEQTATVWALDSDWRRTQHDVGDGSAVTALTSLDGRLTVLTRAADDPLSLVSVWEVPENGEWEALLEGIWRPGASGWVTTIQGDLFVGEDFTRSVITTGPEMWVSDRGAEWLAVEITSGVTPWPPPRITTVVDLEGRLIAFGSRGPSPSAWELVTR